MGLFGSLLKLTLDVATAPIAVVKDVVTLGGAITDEESAIVRKARQLSNDVEDMRDDLAEL